MSTDTFILPDGLPTTDAAVAAEQWAAAFWQAKDALARLKAILNVECPGKFDLAFTDTVLEMGEQ